MYTTLDRSMSTRHFQITDADMSLVGGNAVPSGCALLHCALAENRTLVAVKDTRLACRLLDS